jgi:hypothetical protein
MAYKALIPTAGVGSRLSLNGFKLNKSLYSVGDVPVIKRIIDLFPENIEIVVVLGYQGDIVRSALEILYPEREIIFVSVDCWEGEGSGLGRSILAAEPYLQCPFVFSPNDCFPDDISWNLDPVVSGNWVCSASRDCVPPRIAQEYRGVVATRDGMLDQLSGKGLPAGSVYTGLCGIVDHQKFWSAMQGADPTVGEAAGLRVLDSVKVFQVAQWFDIGNVTTAEITKAHFSHNDHSVLEKADEAIWFVNDCVIKLFADRDVITKRLERLQHLPSDILPSIVQYNSNAYKYKKFSGRVLSRFRDLDLVKYVLDSSWAQLWSVARVIDEDKSSESDFVDEFYRKKTLDRVRSFSESREFRDFDELVNGEYVPSAKRLLDAINWDLVADNIKLVHAHGDFHAENILIGEGKRLCLIDWRHEFIKNELEFGDLYYDLGKFLHGFIVSHEIVAAGKYHVDASDDGYSIDIQQTFFASQCENLLAGWVAQKELDYSLVKTVTGLIFLNIATLHHSPYDIFLFLLGRSILAIELRDPQNLYITEGA